MFCQFGGSHRLTFLHRSEQIRIGCVAFCSLASWPGIRKLTAQDRLSIESQLSWAMVPRIGLTAR